ncbi:uncharacterized protein EV154DRAFT_231121 [Mucor mucedo]|uniref:uncharacterized protein n=1 Tax=Mucor mucedo TaxID=29922 RepID=UPI00221F19C8|nr:uncharacterized protein EV154DRAFT_231121 [Mucor mucedo]KAI7891049.1 hypothetical protein EV154DRAFT_231121 [Mucor mucedo]
MNPNPSKHCLPIALDDDHAMERYVRDKWEKKSFMETTSVNNNDIQTGITQPVEDSSMSITSLQQKGDSSTSISTTDMSTPSLSSTNSSLLSSPTMQFAGRVATETSNSVNPFLKNNLYNPFATISSFSNPVTPPSNNPFTQQQHFVQSPFDISYNTSGNSYFSQNNTSNNNTGSRHNPFYQ